MGGVPALDYHKYWGKSDKTGGYHLLVYHALDVAAISWVLLEKSSGIRCFFKKTYGISGLHLSQFLCFFIALHDLGKFSRSFQQLNTDIAQQNGLSTPVFFYDKRHDVLGLQLWDSVIQNHVLQRNTLGIPAQILADPRDLTEFLAPILNPIFGHHGKPVCANGLVLAHKFTEEDIQAATSFVRDLMTVILPETMPVCKILDIDIHVDHMKKISWWLSGFVAVCDWLGSNREELGFEKNPMPLSDYWEIAKTNAVNQLSQAGFLSTGAKRSLSFQALFGAYTPTPLQKAVLALSLSTSPHLFVLEDVTGAGKTEAALALAHRLMVAGAGEGVYFGLPTMATSNAMYERIVAVYQFFFEEASSASLVLAHGANSLVDAFADSLDKVVREGLQLEEGTTQAFCSYWFADNRKKALLAPFGVGTIDQVLLGILCVKYQSLRLWGLRGKILILDEVHASDAYMHTLTMKLLEFHAASGGSAILLSATLPQKMRQELLSAYQRGLGIPKKAENLSLQYPLLTQCASDGILETAVDTRTEVQRTLHFRLVDQRQEMAFMLIERLTAGHCVAWVCNTVADAIETYTLMKQSDVLNGIELFHARFAMGDRLRIETHVKAQFGKSSTSATRRGKLVIATQVIEQSMDLDFDYMVSDLAPMDLLIQRAGRLRRHVRLANGDPSDQGIDQRGDVSLWIYSPDPCLDCAATWYSDIFPKAAYVYPDHGKLWLTAKWIKDHTCLSVPEGLRTVIEYVFDEEGEGVSQIPEPLQPQTDKASGKKKAEKNQAIWNTLVLNTGYAMTEIWEDDIHATTRLGEETVSIRLAKWEGERLWPWVSDSKHAWPLSEVSVRRFWVAEEAPITDKKLRHQMRLLKETWPGKSEYYIVVPMVEGPDGVWTGSALGQNKQVVRLTYSSEYGLQYFKHPSSTTKFNN